MKTYLIGIGGFIALLALWVGVQWMWRKMFANDISDDDVLAARGTCSGAGCGCTTICKDTRKPIADKK